ncbi:hypothetical protein BC827DRAFT_72313 [Russula dissimulans]|nr:hypothetical protein BC827DRAFT_72313 [Russula dissimulans]
MTMRTIIPVTGTESGRGRHVRPCSRASWVLSCFAGWVHKQLNEAEIALRNEETARKQKHLSEKKLEDKNACAKTINRLLKKRSGTRKRRNQLASGEDRTPTNQTGNGTPAEGEVDEEESAEAAAVPVVEVCYQWTSTLKSSPDAPLGDKMFPSFSIPTSLLSLAVLHQTDSMATGMQ